MNKFKEKIKKVINLVKRKPLESLLAAIIIMQFIQIYKLYGLRKDIYYATAEDQFSQSDCSYEIKEVKDDLSDISSRLYNIENNINHLLFRP